VVANLCLDRLRSRRRWPRAERPAPPDGTDDGDDPVAHLPDGAPGPEARLIAQARSAAIEAALADLPERQRLAVVLRHLEGLSNPEIAGVMEVGVEAVESLTARGRRALAAALRGRAAELGYEEGG
jgi:RNA polymerase sigma-70 factor (ECF subfamily)